MTGSIPEVSLGISASCCNFWRPQIGLWAAGRPGHSLPPPEVATRRADTEAHFWDTPRHLEPSEVREMPEPIRSEPSSSIPHGSRPGNAVLVCEKPLFRGLCLAERVGRWVSPRSAP